MRTNEIKYLGIFIVQSTVFKCAIGNESVPKIIIKDTIKIFS